MGLNRVYIPSKGVEGIPKTANTYGSLYSRTFYIQQIHRIGLAGHRRSFDLAELPNAIVLSHQYELALRHKVSQLGFSTLENKVEAEISGCGNNGELFQCYRNEKHIRAS